MSKVIELRPKGPNAARDMLERILKRIEAGDISELVLLAPNEKDPGNLFYAVTPGIRLSDLLMMKEMLSITADDVWRSTP